MASVSGSRLEFASPNGKKINLILNDGKDISGGTVPGAFNIEIFTAGTGSPLRGVDGTATIGGAVKISSDEVQAATLTSPEQLGSGKFAMIDETGHETITLGTAAQTVSGSAGDTIIGGDAGKARQVIDLTGMNDKTMNGPMTAIGGAGSLIVEAGTGDSITGGSGPTTVLGSGSLSEGERHGKDKGATQAGGDNGDKPQNTISGANDTITGTGGPMTVSGGKDDSIAGGGGSLLVDGNVTGSTIHAGTGGTTVFGGNGDTILGGGGTLLVNIESQSKVHRQSPSTAGSGAETIDLSASHGTTTLRDVSVPSGSGPTATTSVMGFSEIQDVIASKTSVSPSGEFLGTSTVQGTSLVLSFKDGSTMTLANITDISKLTFTR